MDEANMLLDLECSQVAGLTRTKTEFLLARHKALVGFIVMDIETGARHYIDAGAVRRMSCAEAYAFMKPESNPAVRGDRLAGVPCTGVVGHKIQEG